jgi:hypothetical protein
MPDMPPAFYLPVIGGLITALGILWAWALSNISELKAELRERPYVLPDPGHKPEPPLP